MKPKPHAIIARHSAWTLHTLALTAILTVTARGADIVWDGGPTGTGSDWSAGANWTGDSVPSDDIITDNARFDTLTTGQPTLGSARSVSGVDLVTATGGWTIGGSGTLTLGSKGIDSTTFENGTNTISVANIVMGSATASGWALGVSANSFLNATTTNISSNIQLHPTAQLQIQSPRGSSGGSGTINLSGVISNTTGEATSGPIKFLGGSSSKNTFNITGVNTYTGNTLVSLATVNFNSLADDGTPCAFGSTGIINVVETNSASSLVFSGTSPGTTNRRLTIGLTFAGSAGNFNLTNNSADAANTLSFTNTQSVINGGSGNRSITFSGSNTGANVFAQAIENAPSGITSLTKNQAGRWILTNTNTFSGGLTIAGGTIGFNADAALGSAGGAISFTQNASLTATGTATLGSARTITVSASRTASFGLTSTIGTALTIDSKITGAGSVSRVSGSSFTTGTIRFANDTNDFAGSFSTRFGVTEFTSVANSGVPSALGAGTSISANNSTSTAIFRHVGTANSSTDRVIDWSATTGALSLESSGGGTISFLSTTALVTGDGNKALTLGGSNTGANTLAQPIHDSPTSGVTSLLKTGTGKWILTAVSNFTGNTTVNGGTLALGTGATINNSPTVSIAAGATLDLSAKPAAFTIPATQTLSGAGAVSGQNLVVAGTVAPGTTGAGTLSTAAVSLSADAVMQVQLNSSSLTCGQLAVTGDLVIDPNAALYLTDVATVPGLAGGAVLTLASYTGSVSGTFKDLPEGAIINVGANAFTISYNDGNAITLTSTGAYSDWINTFTTLTTSGQRAMTADPDGDGKTNFEEFAFDGNPESGANTGKIQSSVATVGATRHLTISIPVRDGAVFTGSPSLSSAAIDDVTYTIRGSLDLSSFGETVVEVTPAIVTTPVLSTGWSYRTFRLDGDTGSLPRGFLRAEIGIPTTP